MRSDFSVSLGFYSYVSIFSCGKDVENLNFWLLFDILFYVLRVTVILEG